MTNISREAENLAKVICQKGVSIPESFKASDVTKLRCAGHSKIETVIPLLSELIEDGWLSSSQKFGKATYKLLSKGRRKVDKILKDEAKAAREAELDQEALDYRQDLAKEIRKYKRFVITTAVKGKPVNKEFLSAAENYIERTGSLGLVIPCEDITSGKKSSELQLDESLSNFRVVFKDLFLNNKIFISGISVSARMQNPLTGMDFVTTDKGASAIMASPKYLLRYVPNMLHEEPNALMTTGAITMNHYDICRHTSKRPATIAEAAHQYGAIVVEIEDEEHFHYRQLQAAQDGSITDLGVTYLPDGSVRTSEDPVVVLADSHVGYHDKGIFDIEMEMIDKIGAKTVVLHDIFDGASITHHDIGKVANLAKKADQNRISLRDECLSVKRYLEEIRKHVSEVLVVDSNHNEHLSKYLNSARWVDDKVNLTFSIPLADSLIHEKDPLKFAVTECLGLKDENVKWLEPNKSFRKYNTELGIHGHKGANGAKGSRRTFANGVGHCVTAHTHTASIERNTFCVGTSSELELSYVGGLSNWTRTCCIVYKGGTKQLVTFIKNRRGKYTYTL